MRNVLNIEASKIVVPAWHVRQDTAHFSSLHPKNLLTSRSESQQKRRSLKTPNGGNPPMQTH